MGRFCAALVLGALVAWGPSLAASEDGASEIVLPDANSALAEAHALLFTNPAGARAKAEAALASGGDTIGPEQASDFKLLIVMAEVAQDIANDEHLTALQKDLAERDGVGAGDTAQSAHAWLLVAEAASKLRDADDITAYATRAEKAYLSVAPEQYRAQAQAIYWQGIGLLTPFLRPGKRYDLEKWWRSAKVKGLSMKQVSIAINKFDRAIKLFARQPSMKEFDPVLAGLIAARQAAYAIAESRDRRIARKIMSSQKRAEIPWPYIYYDPSKCDVSWEKEPKPDYPDGAQFNLFAGAALYLYDLDASGRVKNPRLLAEAPQGAFEAAVSKAFESARAKIGPGTPDECLRDQLMQFGFILR